MEPSWWRHPIRRFKARIRMIQWGAYERLNWFGETYTDYTYFVRLYPNPGFTLGFRGRLLHWCRAGGFGRHY